MKQSCLRMPWPKFDRRRRLPGKNSRRRHREICVIQLQSRSLCIGLSAVFQNGKIGDGGGQACLEIYVRIEVGIESCKCYEEFQTGASK